MSEDIKTLVEDAKVQGIHVPQSGADDMKARNPTNTIMDTAKEIVYGERAKTYGHPTQNFQAIADLWSAYLGARQTYNEGLLIISPVDVAVLNILQKCARLARSQEHMDTIVDIAGYAGTIDRIVNNK